MRLVKISSRGELSLTQNLIEDIPRYAILSHTWGADDDEVTFDDLRNRSGKSKAGYIKIQICGEQARNDGLQYFWVDTCCIDKANHTELAEAIASMFRWYHHAEKCYVYLSDVSARKCDDNQGVRIWESAFRKSRWFTRGWTLQELIAPKLVEFYSREGDRLGDRNTLEREIHETTEIPTAALRGAPLSDFGVSERMRWAEKRKTKRKEDQAYCLLGIFDVFIPLIYGEGENAFTRLEEEINRSVRKSCKLDLNKLPHAKGAMYNSYEDDHIICHPATRVDLLNQIQDWAQQPYSKSIFWLCGAAGTGKSTISRTFAKWLTEQDRLKSVGLGASFFFKRGEGDRGNASRFFPTIIRDLVLRIHGLDSLIAEVIDSDPSIFDKALGEQFDKLIYQPLQKVNIKTGDCSTFIVVVDALDECDKERNIKVIIDLWSRLPYITSIRLRLFLTSRPDVPILQGIKTIPTSSYQDIVLHEEVPRTTIKNDILIFLKDEFSKIRENYNSDRPSSITLMPSWPGHEVLLALADTAVPLFIVAATMCRFIGDLHWNPRTRLEKILASKGIGATSQMEQTYLPVLQQLSAMLSDPRDAEPLHQEFRTIIGSIVVLIEPLSIASLGDLLQVSEDMIWDRIHPLRSVLRVPVDLETPIRTLHLSFTTWGPELQKLEGHTDLVIGVAFSQDGSLLASASWDKTVRLWNPMTGQEVQKLEGHTEYVHAVAFSPNGSLLASASKDKTVRLWNPTTGQEVQKLEGHTDYTSDEYMSDDYMSAVAFSPDGLLLASTSVDWTVRLWNPTTGQEVRKLEGHTREVRAVAFSPDGSLLASASEDKTVRLWNPTTDQEVQKLEGHTSSVYAVAFSPNDSLLASASEDKTVRLWNPMTGQEVQKLEGHTRSVHAVAFSPNGSLLASASKDKTVRLWNPTTGQEVQKLEGHTGPVYAVAFSADGSPLASASYDQTIRLWNPTTNQEVQKLEEYTDPVREVVFSPDGSLLASAAQDGTVKLWNSTTGEEVQRLEGHTGWIRAIAFSPNGSLLVSASTDKTIRLWNPSTGQEVQKLERHTQEVRAVAFSPDGSLLASTSHDCTVRLWNSTTGEELRRFRHTNYTTCVVFSQDGSLLASGSNDRTVRLWNPTTGQAMQTLKGHTNNVWQVAFSQDTSRLASAAYDRTIRLWNPTTGREVQKLEGHSDGVDVVAFSSDGLLLASASYDQTVRLWDANTGQELRRFESLKWIKTINFSIDNTTLLTNRGVINIDDRPIHCSALRSSTSRPIIINHNWVRQSDYNLLWLPQEYRSYCSAFHGNTIAIGLDSGQVGFIQLDNLGVP